MALHLFQPDEVLIGITPPYDLDDAADEPFNIIRSLVNDNISVPTAVLQLATPIDKLVRDGFDTEANDGVYFLQQTFSALIPQIPQIPHDHPGAAKLAEVVITLMTRPNVLTQAAIEKRRGEYETLGAGQSQLDGISKSVWQGMSVPECRYSDAPASEYVKYSSSSRDGKDHYNPQYEMLPRRFSVGSKEAMEAVKNEWTRHNAFLARLVVNIDLPNRSVYLCRAFEALVPALEEEVVGPGSGVLLSVDVPAAAVWVLYAGDALFEAEIPAQDMGLLGRRGRELWQRENGGGGYSMARWRFWKQRFAWLAEVSEADQVAKTLAGKAVRRIDEIEKARD